MTAEAFFGLGYMDSDQTRKAHAFTRELPRTDWSGDIPGIVRNSE